MICAGCGDDTEDFEEDRKYKCDFCGNWSIVIAGELQLLETKKVINRTAAAMPTIELSPDQELARANVLSAIASGQRELVLSGPAGSGKTTLMRQLMIDLEMTGTEVTLMAPTGKAAARLSELAGRDAATIHSLLYKTIKIKKNAEGLEIALSFLDPRSISKSSGVVICDEASMVGVKIYNDVRDCLPDNAILLCVGDREQLQPVNDTWGANFASPTAVLTQIHRQAAGSRIIQLATAIREGQPWRTVRPDGLRYQRELATIQTAVGWLAMKRSMGTDATLLCFTNSLRITANALVRQMRGLKGTLAIGDQIVCTRNHRGQHLMNGEVRQVADFEWVDGTDQELAEVRWTNYRGTPVLAPGALGLTVNNLQWEPYQDFAYKNDLKTNSYENGLRNRLLRAEYGECLTVHKSQGSQWNSVGILFDSAFEGLEKRNATDFRRMLYTAVTRASKELILFDIGR